MTKIKDQKGITLIALVVTVILMLILMSTAAINMNTNEEYRIYEEVKSDISLLKDKILSSFSTFKQIILSSPLSDNLSLAIGKKGW